MGRGLAAPSWRLSLLCLQEERATFDIHGYGDTLASSCRRLGEWRSFASLVAGEPPFEVCRYMLATLQLVSVWGAESREVCGAHLPLPFSFHPSPPTG